MQIQRIREYEDSPHPVLTDYLSAKSAFDQAKRHLEAVQGRLLEQMEADHTKTLKLNDHGVTKSVTFVQRTTMKVDEAGLRKALTAKVYDRYTVRSLDRKALEKAMGDGEVDPMVVAKYVSEETSKPYLKFTEKEDSSE